MIYAIQHAQTLAFRNKYRNVDVLLIDDIQFLAGKESTQEEFFYTFNALRDAHKQVVVTADKPPKDIPMLEERLTSRFNQGLVTDIKQPDLETRIAILRNRCALEGRRFSIPDDVLLLIADRIRNNIRDLEGCLVRLIALASLTHQEVTLELAEEVLQHYVNPEPDQMTPERIVAAVAERFGVKSDALCGKRRTRNDRAAAAGRDVSDAPAHRPLARRDRSPLRWPRPHDGDVRVREGRRDDRPTDNAVRGEDQRPHLHARLGMNGGKPVEEWGQIRGRLPRGRTAVENRPIRPQSSDTVHAHWRLTTFEGHTESHSTDSTAPTVTSFLSY